jgi:hypothetical protein
MALILILDIPAGMYMQRYILRLLTVRSQPTRTAHLQYVIRQPVSASGSHHLAHDRKL